MQHIESVIVQFVAIHFCNTYKINIQLAWTLCVFRFIARILRVVDISDIVSTRSRASQSTIWATWKYPGSPWCKVIGFFVNVVEEVSGIEDTKVQAVVDHIRIWAHYTRQKAQQLMKKVVLLRTSLS